MIDLIHEEHQQRQHDHQQEPGGAAEEIHKGAQLADLPGVLAHDVAVGDDVLVGYGVVVTLRGVGAVAVRLLNVHDAVGVQGVLVFDDGVEAHDVAHL